MTFQPKDLPSHRGLTPRILILKKALGFSPQTGSGLRKGDCWRCILMLALGTLEAISLRSMPCSYCITI